jgi:hypothetical protein
VARFALSQPDAKGDPAIEDQSPILREAIQRDSHIREILIFSIRNQGRVGPATTWKRDG